MRSERGASASLYPAPGCSRVVAVVPPRPAWCTLAAGTRGSVLCRQCGTCRYRRLRARVRWRSDCLRRAHCHCRRDTNAANLAAPSAGPTQRSTCSGNRNRLKRADRSFELRSAVTDILVHKISTQDTHRTGHTRTNHVTVTVVEPPGALPRRLEERFHSFMKVADIYGETAPPGTAAVSPVECRVAVACTAVR